MTAPIWFDSTEAGAPVLNNAAGSFIALLRAVLINGFGVKAITSIAVASGVATVTCPAHGFSSAYGKWLKITGASAPALDGVKQQTIVDANTFTYPAPGVADGSYTATDARRAPLGWTEPYAGTNKGIFARSAPESTAQLLRVNDTHTAPSTSTISRILCLESATGVDAFTGPCPTSAQFTDGAPWQKGADTATAKTWALVGNDRGFYLATQLGTGTTFALYFFGDGVPYYAGDAFFTMLTGQAAATYSATPGLGLDSLGGYDGAPGAATQIYAARGQPVSSTSAEMSEIAGPNHGARPGGSGLQPLTFDHVVIGDTVHVIGASKQIRGEMPGLSVPLAAAPYSALQVVSAVSGAAYVAVPYNSGGTQGQWLIRLSGEWY